MCGLGVAVGCRMKHAKCVSAWKGFPKPLMCGLAVGCRMKHAKSALEGFPKALGEGCQVKRFKGFKLFKGLERLEGLRAGKRQAWTPIRSHGCVALGCLLAAG